MGDGTDYRMFFKAIGMDSFEEVPEPQEIHADEGRDAEGARWEFPAAMSAIIGGLVGDGVDVSLTAFFTKRR